MHLAHLKKEAEQLTIIGFIERLSDHKKKMLVARYSMYVNFYMQSAVLPQRPNKA